MFSLLNFFQTAPSRKTSTTTATVLQITVSVRSDVRPIATAIVTKTIEPTRKGQVKYQGSWWTAQCNSETVLPDGAVVQVMYRQNLTLYVEPLLLSKTCLPQTALSS